MGLLLIGMEFLFWGMLCNLWCQLHSVMNILKAAKVYTYKWYMQGETTEWRLSFIMKVVLTLQTP